jgi:WD40 repeat protein
MRAKVLVILAGLLFLNRGFAQEQQIDLDLQGHRGLVRSLVFSGEKLISTGEDKTIRIWDLRTGHVAQTLRPYSTADEGSLNCLALSPDGRYLAFAGYPAEYGIRIIDLYQNTQIAQFLGHTDVVTDLEFSPDGVYLASASADLSAIVWDVRNLSLKPSTKQAFISNLKGFSQRVLHVAFSQNSRQLAVGGAEGLVRLFTLPTTPEKFKEAAVIEVRNLKKHTVAIRGLGFGSTGLVTASQDGKVCIWNQEPEVVHEFKTGIEIAAMTVFEEWIAVGGLSPNKILILNGTQKNQQALYAGQSSAVLSMAAAQNRFASGGDSEIHVWDKTGKMLLKLSNTGISLKTAQFVGDLKIGFSDSPKGVFQQGFDFLNLERIALSNTIKPASVAITQAYQLGAIKTDPNTDGKIRCAVQVPQGTVVGCDFSLKLFAPSGELLREFVGHSGAIFSLSTDQKHLLSTSADQSVKLWSLEDEGYWPSPWEKMGELWREYFVKVGAQKLAQTPGKQSWQELLQFLKKNPNYDVSPIEQISNQLNRYVKPLASLVATQDGNWICFTESGYYAASSGGEVCVGWKINTNSTELSQYQPAYKYRSLLMRPDVVKKTIELRSEAQALEQAQARRDPKDQIAKARAPQIEWIDPIQPETELKSPILQVKFKVSSELPLVEVKLMLNGRRLATARGFRPISETFVQGGKEYNFEVDFSHFQGKNYIQVYARNELMSALSPPKNVNYFLGEDELPDMDQMLFKPNLYVLSIGISDFADSKYNLNFAHADAEAISGIFGTQSGKVFRQVNIRQLTNKQATKKEILEGFSWLRSQASPRDVVILFIASHGFNHGGRFYLLPHDGNSQDLDKTAIKWADFSDLAVALPCRTVIFLDACHSGALASGLRSDNTEALRELVGEEKGVIVMSASTGKETSLEDEKWGHGAFTLSLIEGMKNGKADLLFSDGQVEIRELDTFVFQYVKKLTQNRQNPTTQKPSSISELILYKVL